MNDTMSKTKIYLLIISLIVSLMTMAVMKLNSGSATVKSRTSPSRTLGALEKSAESPEMKRFLQREKNSESADEDAYHDLGKQ